MRTFNLIGILLFGLLLQSCGQIRESGYTFLLGQVYRDTVPQITSQQLSVEMQQGTQPLLLDTRSEKEYRVSRLANARHVGYADFNEAQLLAWPKDTPLVVYCSVGYRSERIGERLLAAGYTDVRNLYGGLFEWVNQGGAVYDGQGIITTKVHGYTRAWGVWLQKGEKVYD